MSEKCLPDEVDSLPKYIWWGMTTQRWWLWATFVLCFTPVIFAIFAVPLGLFLGIGLELAIGRPMPEPNLHKIWIPLLLTEAIPLTFFLVAPFHGFEMAQQDREWCHKRGTYPYFPRD
jgi:hypothetical protein